MNGFKLFALAAVAAICLALSAPKTHAQVQVDIGVAPVCPYGYYDVPPYDCAPTATTAQSGLPAASSSARARGFMAMKTSTAT